MIEEIVVDCPSCGEPFALDVDTTGIFVRCRPGEILSISVTAD